MQVHDLMTYLETELASSLYLSSGFSTTRAWVEHSDQVKALVRLLQADPTLIPVVVERIKQLASDGGDPMYTHQHDNKLTIYAYVIAYSGFAENVPVLLHIRRAVNLFWARRMTQYLLYEVKA